MSEIPSLPAPAEGIDQSGELDAGDLGLLAWVTHVGHLRSRNEDRLLVRSVFGGSHLLMVVADGAGGHDAGDRAAELVATTFHDDFPVEGEPPAGEPAEWLYATIHKAHARVTSLATGSARPPASTVVGLLVERASLAVWRFHVGDSRIYGRLPDGTTEPWTRDHNIINGLIDRGLPVGQALKIAEGGRLTQVVGGAAVPEEEIQGPFALEPGLTVSITSDGAYAYHLEVEGFLNSLDPATGTPKERCDALRESILSGPAPDNLTAVLWDVPAELPAVVGEGRSLEPRTLGGPPDIGAAEVLPLKEGWDVGFEEMDAPDVQVLSGLPGSTADDTLDPFDLPEDDPPRPGAGFGTFLAVVLCLFLVIAYLRGKQDDEFPAPVPTPIAIDSDPTVEASPEPETTPAESPEATVALAEIDAAWWAGLGPDEQAARRTAVETLFGGEALPNTVLTAPTGSGGAPTPLEFEDWPRAGGQTAADAAAGWDAAERLSGEYPVVAEVPMVATRLRSAACERVLVGWPRVRGAVADEGRLADHLSGCLQAEGDTVTVRLGDWPHAGWSLADLDGVVTAGTHPGGDAALSLPDGGGNDRMVELGMLTRALADARISELQVELVIHLPEGPASPGEPDPVVAVAAIQGLIRGALDGPAENVSVTTALGDSLLPTPEGGVSAAVSARLADLNRRVEVTLFRPASLELEDEEPASEGTPASEGSPTSEATASEPTTAPETTPEPTVAPEVTPEPTVAPEASPAGSEG